MHFCTFPLLLMNFNVFKANFQSENIALFLLIYACDYDAHMQASK